MPAFLDLTGQRSGKLVVKSFYRMVNGHAVWRCVCDCDSTGTKTRLVRGASITASQRRPNEGTRSCGCTRRPRALKPVLPERMWSTMDVDEVRIVEGLNTSQFHSQIGKTKTKHPECRSWRWTARKLGGGKIEVRRIR